MPANPPPEVRRGKLLHGLFWGGIALAPLAVLILLFGQSTGALRIAVILAVLTVVMIGVSIALRPSVEMLRVDIEHRVLDEVERVRVRAREETTTAARNTHRALSDKIHILSETMEDLRAQLDDVAASGVLAPHSPSPALGGPPGAPGVVRRTETVHVTRRTTTVDAGDEGTGTVYGSKAAVEGEWRDRPDDRHDDRRWDQRWDGMAQGDRWAAVRADESGREMQVGERRASVHSDDRGSEMRVEDRWAALRRDEPREGREYLDGDPGWEAAFRTMGRPPAPKALPPARGESPSRYTDDRDDDRYREPARSRGRDDRDARDRDPRDRDARDRDRDYDRDRGYDRDRDPRDRDARDRDSRDRDSRDRDSRDRDARDRDRDYDRDRDPRDRDRDYDRDRDRDYDRDRDRDYDRDRGGYPPRPRSGHPSEYDR